MEYHRQFIEYADVEFERILKNFHQFNINMSFLEERRNLENFITW